MTGCCSHALIFEFCVVILEECICGVTFLSNAREGSRENEVPLLLHTLTKSHLTESMRINNYYLKVSIEALTRLKCTPYRSTKYILPSDK